MWLGLWKPTERTQVTAIDSGYFRRDSIHDSDTRDILLNCRYCFRICLSRVFHLASEWNSPGSPK